MSDIWEHLYSASSLAPAGDDDGDGADNLAESIAGTDPFDDASVLGFELSASSAALIASWRESPGKSYSLEASADLREWAVISTIGAPDDSDPTSPTSSTSPSPELPDPLDSWTPWGAAADGFDVIWASLYGFDTNATTPGYGFSEHLDSDGQANFVESYTGTDPGSNSGKFIPILDIARSRLLLQWFGSDGALRYDLDCPVNFGSYEVNSLAGTPFEGHGSLFAPTFSGASPDSSAGQVTLNSYVSGAEWERRSPGFIDPDPNITPDLLDPAEAIFHDAGDGVLIIDWPESPAHPNLIVITRTRIADWYYGQEYMLRSGQMDPSGGLGACQFYRLTATDASAVSESAPSPTAWSLWERSVLKYLSPDEDWDGDGLANASEELTGSDPLEPDSDHDGVLDLYESLAGTIDNQSPLEPFEALPATGLVVFSPEPGPFDPVLP